MRVLVVLQIRLCCITLWICLFSTHDMPMFFLCSLLGIVYVFAVSRSHDNAYAAPDLTVWPQKFDSMAAKIRHPHRPDLTGGFFLS
jgi:hypothetical protein